MNLRDESGGAPVVSDEVRVERDGPVLRITMARARILRAAPFDAETALRIGLVHEIAPAERLDGAVEETVLDLLRGAPGALATIKRLPEALGHSPAVIRNSVIDLLAVRLARDDGQEGLRAFLEKRPAAWAPAADPQR
jgi:methylglutaconyl-CoA hydratase